MHLAGFVVKAIFNEARIRDFVHHWLGDEMRAEVNIFLSHLNQISFTDV